MTSEVTPTQERTARLACEQAGDEPDRRVDVLVQDKKVGTMPAWALFLNLRDDNAS